MDFRKLKYFVTVAELGGFTRAAQFLRIAQPALSRQIGDLESEVGLQLLHRNGRGVVLTVAGQYFLGRCKTLLEDIEATEGSLQQFKTGLFAPVKIGMPAVIAQNFVAPLVKRMRSLIPRIELRIVEASSDQIQESLLRGRMDVGVFYGHTALSALVPEVLANERMFLVSSPDTPLSNGALVTLGDLADRPMILPARPHPLRRLIDFHIPKLNVEIEIDSLQTIKDLVQENLGFSILPPIAFHKERAARALAAIPIEDPGITRQMLLAITEHSRIIGAVDLVSEHIRNQARAMVEARQL